MSFFLTEETFWTKNPFRIDITNYFSGKDLYFSPKVPLSNPGRVIVYPDKIIAGLFSVLAGK